MGGGAIFNLAVATSPGDGGRELKSRECQEFKANLLLGRTVISEF